jgi:hypothetical protein
MPMEEYVLTAKQNAGINSNGRKHIDLLPGNDAG